MSHLAGNCHCGKIIHFPKDAQICCVWRCHTQGCGKEWVLTNQGGGKPLHETRSKRSPKETYQNRPSYSNNSGSGCIVVGLILLSTFVGGAYKLLEQIAHNNAKWPIRLSALVSLTFVDNRKNLWRERFRWVSSFLRIFNFKRDEKLSTLP